MHTSLLGSVLFAALVAGCAGSGQFTYASEATPPNLVVVSPGVQVIADQDEPIFYSGNYYWRNQGGNWYRSAYHTHGWARFDAPVEIRSISRPTAYAHYHGETHPRVVDERRQVTQPTEVRDHGEVVAPKHDDGKHDDKRDNDDKKHD